MKSFLLGVTSAKEPRQKRLKKRNLHEVNEHSEVVFNEGYLSAVAQQNLFYQPVSSAKALPIPAGFLTVLTPAASKAANLSAAVPFPPAIIAPA